MIECFEFVDREARWSLHRTCFGSVNLLVGISGVGKSRILQAIDRVASCGAGIGSAPANSKWALEINVGGRGFKWEAETGAAEQTSGRGTDAAEFVLFELSGRAKKGKFVKERLATQDGKVIASRDGDRVTFGDGKAPKLKETESLISLFQKESTVTPLYDDLSHVFRSTGADFEFSIWSRRQIAQWRKEIVSLEQLRNTMRIPLLVRFDLLRTLSPTDYAAIVASFSEIFETVKDVRVGLARDLQTDVEDDDPDRLTLAVDEDGISRPIRLHELSSGMRRTLRHLVELALAPGGSTILIDEYENSLGVSCLPSITRHLLERTRDIQLIATSHHPYVINNIDLSYWRVVSRHGSDVHVIEAAAIPELNSASRQEAFIRLMNSDAYKRGVSGS